MIGLKAQCCTSLAGGSRHLIAIVPCSACCVFVVGLPWIQGELMQREDVGRLVTNKSCSNLMSLCVMSFCVVVGSDLYPRGHVVRLCSWCVWRGLPPFAVGTATGGQPRWGRACVLCTRPLPVLLVWVLCVCASCFCWVARRPRRLVPACVYYHIHIICSPEVLASRGL